MNQKPAISNFFSNLSDTRRYNRRHKLIDIITISICAVICNADSFEHIAEYGRAKYEWLKSFLELPDGIPSADTFERVFAMIDPEEFKACFLDWIQAICQLTNGEVIAIDGKTLRRSHDKSLDISPIHMVSAWACANGLVIGQIKTDEKSNEITAIPELLKQFEIKGCVITIDAMGCQRKIAQGIIEKGGDYVFSLKGNQSSLHDDIKLFFEGQDKKILDHHETVDNEHGKIEIRNYWTSSSIEWLHGLKKWKNLRTVCMVERERQFENRTQKQSSYYISSLENDAEKIGSSIRNHWQIENKLHWVLDMTFREDESRIREKNASQNFAVLRHIVLNMIQKETSLKKSIKAKRLRSGWDNDYLLKVLNA